MNALSIKRGLLGFCFTLVPALSLSCGGQDEPTDERADAGNTQPDAGAPVSARADAAPRDSAAALQTDASARSPVAYTPPSGSKELLLRADSFVLSSPDVVLRPFGRETSVATQVQQAIQSSLMSDTDPDNNMDGLPNAGDGDGIVDMNLIFRFRAAAGPATESPGAIESGSARCKHPFDASKPCASDPAGPFQQIAAKYDNATDCKLAGTDELAKGACFVSEVGKLVLELPLLGPVPLEEAQLIGSWVGAGAGGIRDGHVRGFLSEAVARQTKLGADLPPLAVTIGIKPGTELALFFSDSSKKTNSAGTPGWWFSIRFTAKPIAIE